MYLPTGSLQERAVLNIICIICIRVRLFSRHLLVIFLFPLSGFKPTSMEQVNFVTETICCIRIGLDDWLARQYAERIGAILYQYFGRIIRFCSTNVIRRITYVYKKPMICHCQWMYRWIISTMTNEAFP